MPPDLESSFDLIATVVLGRILCCCCSCCIRRKNADHLLLFMSSFTIGPQQQLQLFRQMSCLMHIHIHQDPMLEEEHWMNGTC